jgi:hypothetical protein
MIESKIKGLALLVIVAIASTGAILGGEGDSTKFTSERRQHKFLGATRVVLDKFNRMDKEGKTATLQLDGNELVFSSFGDSRVTLVFYKPFDVKLTRLNTADPTGQGRRIYSVELPTAQMQVLGKNSLRLVSPIAAPKGQPAGARLLLVDPSGKVLETVELRPIQTST